MNYTKVYFISTRTFICFQIKKACFKLFNDRNWLGKVVMTLFKKISTGIDGSGVFSANDVPLPEKYLLNSFVISSSPALSLLPILSFWGKFDFLLCFALPIIYFHNSPSFLFVIFELEYLLWVMLFFLFGLTLNCLK